VIGSYGDRPDRQRWAQLVEDVSDRAAFDGDRVCSPHTVYPYMSFGGLTVN
jgi:hypothetical protein